MMIINKLVLWFFALSILLLVTLDSLFRRIRMSHENGLVCKARIRILDHLTIPPSDFFEPGKEFACRLRHASVSFEDDARLVVRSASLKFDDSDQDSPLDIMMNTGTGGPFAHAWHFLKFFIATVRGREQHLEPYLDENPDIAKGITESICYPDTFALLNYHSKTALGYRDITGKDWYIKFKLAPWDRLPDRGRPTEQELEHFWLQDTKPGEARSRNFLKDEYRRRIKLEPVKYHLQAQFHEVIENEDREILNCAIPWDEESHPWLDLAEVEVNAVMPTEAGNHTSYDICNHPPCMSIPTAKSIFDPASINYLRAKDNRAKRARIFGYKLWGQRDRLVDDRNPFSSSTPPIVLPQNDTPDAAAMRADQLISKQIEYQYAPFDGTPPHVKKLPKGEDFTKQESSDMIKDIAIAILNACASYLITFYHKLFRSRKTLAAFDRYYPLWKVPKVSNRFSTDLEFGRQRLNGVNPVLLKKCTNLPEKFPVTDAIVDGLLAKGDSLASAAAGARLYLLDHEKIGNIKVKNGYLAVPISLFYVNTDGQMLPIAIQLEQTPGPEVPIFTPKDPFWLWTTVKAYVQSADATYHEVASHLLRTHFVMETFVVAMHRQLHERHPIHQLLAPHFHSTLAINHSARFVMLAEKKLIDQTLALGAKGSKELLCREYSNWDFSLTNFEKDLADRGVDNEATLPYYFYRDDGLLLWRAIGKHVSAVVDYWYADDDAICTDTELQAWLEELVSPDIGRVRGLPEDGKISNRENIKKVLKSIIFTCTAEHASVNNGQYEMFGYPPNVPGSMYQPWPTNKHDPLSEMDFVSRLPNHLKCIEQLSMVHLLSKPARWMMGTFEMPYFHGNREMWRHTSEFRQELDRISEIINKRNRGLEYPYNYLNPQQISESIMT